MQIKRFGLKNFTVFRGVTLSNLPQRALEQFQRFETAKARAPLWNTGMFLILTSMLGELRKTRGTLSTYQFKVKILPS